MILRRLLAATQSEHWAAPNTVADEVLRLLKDHHEEARCDQFWLQKLPALLRLPLPALCCASHWSCLWWLSSFAPNAAAAIEEDDELWFPDRSGWNAGEPVPTPSSTLTTEEHLDLLDSHPLFTGCCPQCRWECDRSSPPAARWDCPDCGWKDDSI